MYAGLHSYALTYDHLHSPAFLCTSLKRYAFTYTPAHQPTVIRNYVHSYSFAYIQIHSPTLSRNDLHYLKSYALTGYTNIYIYVHVLQRAVCHLAPRIDNYIHLYTLVCTDLHSQVQAYALSYIPCIYHLTDIH